MLFDIYIFRHELEDFYSVSYAWYGIINLLVCVVVGLIVSFVVNLIYHGKNRTE